MISDGQAWSGDVAMAVTAARQMSIPVFVVGVGTTTGALIPEPPLSNGFTPPPTIRAVLDRDSLMAIARAGGGEYFEIGRQPDRDIAFNILSAIRRRAPPLQVDESFEDLYWWCLFTAALTLCLGALLIKGHAELWWQALGAAAAILVLAAATR